MAFCSKCGTQIQDNAAAFCPNCGTPVSNTNSSVITEQPTKTDKPKKKKGKLIAVIVSLLTVAAIVAAIIILKPFGNKIDIIVDDENKWYIAESTVTISYDEDKSYEYTYKYLPDGQLSERTMQGETVTYAYDTNNRLLSFENDDNRFSFEYSEKGSKFVGESNVIRDDGDTYYMVVKYDRNHRLLLTEQYTNDRIVSTQKNVYYPNGKLNQSINVFENGDYSVQTLDENGVTTQSEIYNSDGTLSSKTTYEYEDGRLIGAKSVDKDGKVTQSEKLDKKDDKTIKTSILDSDNEKQGYKEYIYDKYDHLVETKIYNEDNELSQHTINIWRLKK